MYIYIRIHVHMCVYASMHFYMHIFVYAQICIGISLYFYVHIFAQMHKSM